MQLHRAGGLTGVRGFFRLGQGHDTLPNYYMMNFALRQHHGWTLPELEGMMPFERELYIHMLHEHLKEEYQKQQERLAKQNG
jgi:hypothetical protein